MVLFKIITNFLALALKCQVSQVVLAEAAEEENRRVKLFPDWTRACQVFVQALVAILNVLFLLNSGPIHFPHSKYFGQLDGRTIGYISLFISYVLAIGFEPPSGFSMQRSAVAYVERPGPLCSSSSTFKPPSVHLIAGRALFA